MLKVMGVLQRQLPGMTGGRAHHQGWSGVLASYCKSMNRSDLGGLGKANRHTFSGIRYRIDERGWVESN